MPPPTPPPPTRSWSVRSDRLAGKDDFVTWLRANQNELGPCKTQPGHARLRFAEWGGFYRQEAPPQGGFPAGMTPIPTDTVFEVYEPYEAEAKRNKQVVLIVDMGLTGPEPITYDDVQVWRCTYTPYLGGPSGQEAPP